VVAHGLKMCPIVFGDDVVHINEWAGLKVKFLKCSYFKSRLFVLFNIWYSNVVSYCPHEHGIQTLNLINMHSGRGLM